MTKCDKSQKFVTLSSHYPFTKSTSEKRTFYGKKIKETPLVRKSKFNRNERCGFGKFYLQSEWNNIKKIWTKVTELQTSRFCNQLCHSLIEVFAVISQFRNLKSDDRNEWNWDWSHLWVNLKVKITNWFFCERSRYKKKPNMCLDSRANVDSHLLLKHWFAAKLVTVIRISQSIMCCTLDWFGTKVKSVLF